MGLNFDLSYHELVVEEDIPRLPKLWKDNIRRAIENKLTSHPEVYGKPLRRSLSGYRKLRVGDYRVIFKIEDMVVKIFVIQHRAQVYKIAQKRLY